MSTSLKPNKITILRKYIALLEKKSCKARLNTTKKAHKRHTDIVFDIYTKEKPMIFKNAHKIYLLFVSV